MKLTYKLQRKDRVTEDFETDQKVVQTIKSDINKKRPNKYIEQDLGTKPIDAKELLYNQLEI